MTFFAKERLVAHTTKQATTSAEHNVGGTDKGWEVSLNVMKRSNATQQTPSAEKKDRLLQLSKSDSEEDD